MILALLNTLDTKEKISDKEIVEQIIATGDKELFHILYERYADKVYRKCLLLTKDRETSKDLAHDILIKVFLNLSKLKKITNFSLWVHSITYNHCIDHLRSKQKVKYEDFEEQAFENISEEDIEREQQELKELQLSELEAVFEKLNEEEKLILLMRYQDGLSIKDIAHTLRIGESAVKMRLKRSRDHLAELLKKYRNR